MSLENIDEGRILDLISGTLDGGWNDGLEAFVGASNDGEFIHIEIQDEEGRVKKFYLSIES
jgi:hypothetical protein